MIEATLTAPLAELFQHGRRDENYAVAGTLKFSGPSSRETTIEDVKVLTRGHTSLRESECEFPKLKLDLSTASGADGSPFSGAKAIKIGTHCGNGPDAPGGKYGRWANEKATHREAFVYRLLEVMNVPSLKARPARITYVASKGDDAAQSPLVRSAMFLEDDDEAMRRFGAKGQLPAKQFGSAPSVFAMADIARLTFAQAMIGNFDWCLRMFPNDTYRCNDTTPIWNVIGFIKPDGKSSVPIINDFDLAGMVTTRHVWFDRIFNSAFAPTEQEVEVLAQVQRTRSVFERSLLDATRAEFAGRKQAAYEALNQSALDESGRSAAKTYLDSFFAAIETDEAFYRPIVVARAKISTDAAQRQPVCGTGDIPIGTPVSAPLETSGDKSRVVLLDALWHWSEKCEEVRTNPVWIATSAIGTEYPRK